MMKRLFVFIPFLVFISCSPQHQGIRYSRNAAVQESVIRVRVVASADKVSLESSDRMRLYRLDGGSALAQVSPAQKKKASLTVTSSQIDSPCGAESWDGIIGVNGVFYRGKITLHKVLGRIDVINHVTMDEYLAGVVPSEMSSSWPIEALKSQAVAARTYAYYTMEKQKSALFDLDASTNFQVYKGVSVENKNSTAAVRATSGMILLYNNKPVLSFFHSTCGGRTASNETVWSGESLPYLKSVKCQWCGDSPKFSWNDKIEAEDMRKKLSRLHPGVNHITGISFKKLDGRVTEVLIKHSNGSLRLTGNEFRMMMDPNRVKSLLFDGKKNGRSVILSGKGWGHGVGMCQYGARGLALKGKDFRYILGYYYTGTRLGKY